MNVPRQNQNSVVAGIWILHGNRLKMSMVPNSRSIKSQPFSRARVVLAGVRH